jgi:hypothetical protein
MGTFLHSALPFCIGLGLTWNNYEKWSGGLRHSLSASSDGWGTTEHKGSSPQIVLIFSETLSLESEIFSLKNLHLKQFYKCLCTKNMPPNELYVFKNLLPKKWGRWRISLWQEHEIGGPWVSTKPANLPFSGPYRAELYDGLKCNWLRFSIGILT